MSVYNEGNEGLEKVQNIGTLYGRKREIQCGAIKWLNSLASAIKPDSSV
jgi:hypothetical protein